MIPQVIMANNKHTSQLSIDLPQNAKNLLGDFVSSPEVFPMLDPLLATFRESAFLKLSLHKQFRQINEALCQLIFKAPPGAFLFSAVLDYFERIEKEKILSASLNFTTFEFWLNNFSGLSDQENYELRAKIVGKYLPREEYQAFFPIGMDRSYGGTHFITAHLSPDVDTMIASFWGWMDAFAARIGTGLHLWCLPGGPPDSPFTAVFRNLFGSGLFHHLPRIAQTLSLTAMDLVTQKLFTKELGDTLISTIDHGSNEKAVILVNEQGNYLGDWRSSDVELVRQIIIVFKSFLHWFENNILSHLITLFAKENLSVKDLPAFNSAIFDVRILDCGPALEFTEKQKNDLNDFLVKVINVNQGLEGTVRDLNHSLKELSIVEMSRFQETIESLPSGDIFDEQGHLKEDRPKIFHRLKEIIHQLNKAIQEVRNYAERLDVALKIKYAVIGLPHLYASLDSDVDEMRQKIQNYDFLTTVIHEQDGSLFPVGIVRLRDLRENGLGTVSFRDFCNFEEVKMASYLEVISVIDHHKSALKTPSVPTALIGDAQSCNILIAEQVFQINDKYSTGGMSLEEIDAQLKTLSSSSVEPHQIRVMQRLLKRRLVAQKADRFYINPKREFNEYLCFLNAILDDTDLLTKVSHRDLLCIAELLNRLKSLSLGHEVEIIDFDAIPRDKNFAKEAAKRILQQPDMYSVYQKIYSLRESEVELNLGLCIKGEYSNIFLDAKEQNGCARIGQTKMFVSNFPFYLKHANEVRQVWLKKSQQVFQGKSDIDLHIHMISTIASAEEVYTNTVGSYEHQDELWIWAAPTQQGYSHLNSFLTGFQSAIKKIKEGMSLEFFGENSEEFLKIFNLHFADIPKNTAATTKVEMPFAVLRFKAGALNSRKSMISPFLPRLIA